MTEKSQDPRSGIRLPYAVQSNGLKHRPFSFLKNYSDQNGDQVLGKYINWKPPKLYKGKRWWVEYQFRIPEELRPRYKGAKWKGFPAFEDINRYKTDEYAQLLSKAVKYGLKQGFNPFEYEKKVFLVFQQAATTNRSHQIYP
jgi:hypothetical protein